MKNPRIHIFKTGGGERVVLTDGHSPANSGFSAYGEKALKNEVMCISRAGALPQSIHHKYKQCKPYATFRPVYDEILKLKI